MPIDADTYDDVEYQILYGHSPFALGVTATVTARNHDEAVRKYFATSWNHSTGAYFAALGPAENSQGYKSGLGRDSIIVYMIMGRPASPYVVGRSGPNSFNHFWLRRQTKDNFPEYGTYREIRSAEPGPAWTPDPRFQQPSRADDFYYYDSYYDRYTDWLFDDLDSLYRD